jgi:uncharacterized protein (TIGR03066 family)
MKLLCIGLLLPVALPILGAYELQEKTQDKASIIGIWEVQKSEEAPTGSTVEFTKDGKLILISKMGDKTKKLEATYKLEGKKLITRRQEDGKDKTDVLTIQKLTEETLVTLNEKGKIDQLKRKPK